jgi:hypothetical protein
VIRRARPEGPATLSHLAMRYKAHWGYSEEFLAASRADLDVRPADLPAFHVYPVEDERGRPIGF